MATETTNLKLTKPDKTDFYDISVHNENMDKIDQEFGKKADKTDIPSALPASGGNADTVDGKHASDFANANHTHMRSQITDFPTSMLANGGNADTVDNIHISVVTALPTTKNANTLYLVKG